MESSLEKKFNTLLELIYFKVESIDADKITIQSKITQATVELDKKFRDYVTELEKSGELDYVINATKKNAQLYNMTLATNELHKELENIKSFATDLLLDDILKQLHTLELKIVIYSLKRNLNNENKELLKKLTDNIMTKLKSASEFVDSKTMSGGSFSDEIKYRYKEIKYLGKFKILM